MVHVTRLRPLFLALVVLGLLGVQPVSAITPHCGNNPEFLAYQAANGTGTLLGYECADDDDANWGNTSGEFQGTDNNHASSIVLYGTSGVRTCLIIHLDPNFLGPTIIRTWDNGGTFVWNMMGSFNNAVSSSRIYWTGLSTICQVRP